MATVVDLKKLQTFTPDVFAGGVAAVGISNWLTYFETIPAYWRHSALPLMHKYIGDPSRPDDRRRLEAISPLFKVARGEGPMPLLHGARDARVNVRESGQMAAALQQAGKNVRVVIFPDEGHRYRPAARRAQLIGARTPRSRSRPPHRISRGRPGRRPSRARTCASAFPARSC